MSKEVGAGGRFDIFLDSDLFLHRHYPFDSDSMKYEKGSQILCHVIPLRRFCRPWNMGLARGLSEGQWTFSHMQLWNRVPILVNNTQ